MKRFLLIFGVLLIVCFGCKNKPKDQNGSNIPVLDAAVPQLHTMVDGDFLGGKLFADTVLYPKIEKITNLKRSDQYFATRFPEIEGRTRDTISTYTNSMDTIVLRRVNEIYIYSMVLRSPHSELPDEKIKVGASKDVFKDRFRNIMDNDTIEITDLEGFVSFRAILAGGRIKMIKYVREY